MITYDEEASVAAGAVYERALVANAIGTVNRFGRSIKRGAGGKEGGRGHALDISISNVGDRGGPASTLLCFGIQ